METSKIFTSIKKTYRFLKKEGLLRLFILIIILVFIGSFGLIFFEDHMSLPNAMWWSFVTLTTVGYGDIAPLTPGGRIVGIIMMFFGIGTLGLFTATIASIFVEKKFREDKGMLEINVTKHFIICGWNHRASDIIHGLQADSNKQDTPIVILAEIDAKPVDHENIYFIHGEVTNETLIKANIKDASTVIILLDDRLEPYSRDAKAVLNTLTVESINPDVYSIVEIIDSKNINHCRRAKADEVIVSEDFNVKLITQAALNHGITNVISEILSKKYGNDFYKITAPQSVIDKSFLDALTILKQEQNSLIIAVESPEHDAILTNPDADYIIKNNDQIVVISDRKPLC